MSYYNSAAILGGMTLEEAAEELRGGWAPDAPFPDKELTPMCLNIAAKYQIEPHVVGALMHEIYRYDTFLMQGRAQDAYAVKQNFVQNMPGRKKFWTYVRNKIHAGATHPLRMTAAQRDQRKANAAALRQQRMMVLQDPNLAWFGSNPYRSDGTRLGAYKGLAYWRPKPAKIPYIQRYPEVRQIALGAVPRKPLPENPVKMEPGP